MMSPKHSVKNNSPQRKIKLETLDNIVEIHSLMKMFEDTKFISKEIGEYNQISILFKIWEKLCEDEGRL